jgi:hypothetical protein
MAAQVIVKLIADPSGLQPGVEALETLGQIDKAIADEFKATNKAFQDRSKILNTTNASTEKLATASKNLVESITGGAITQATKNIEQLGAKIEKSNADTIAFTKTVDLAKQKLSTLREGSAEFDKLSNEIEAAELAMANFSDEASSSRGRLRQYRETLLQLEDAGLSGTQVFQDMAEAAGELQDAVGDTSARIQALGSDTFALDAGVQVIQGVAGAFSVAQGAAALFGDESKELQQALLKVNAAMAILQGITQIQTVLQGESSASIAVGIALQRLQALQTNLQAAAESRFIVIRYGAIVAQKALNVVMALNPAGALLLAISAVAGALLYFTSNSDKSVEANERLNQELESQNEVLKLNSASFERNTALRVAEVKATGALASAIAEIEKQGLKSRAKDLAENIKLNQKRLESLKNTNEEIISINKALDADQQELATLNNQGKIKQIEIQNTLADEANKSATASAQARIAQAKKDSQSELNASIAAILVRQREELAAEGLTQGERELIVANNERAISDIRLQIQQKSLDDQIALAQANAIQQKDGFRKLEGDIQVVILRAQKDTLGKNKAQATLIEAEKNEAIKNLRKQLFKDLELIEITEYGRSRTRQHAFDREVIKDQVLQSAQLAQAILQGRQQRNQEEQDRDKDKIEKAKALRQRLIEAEVGLASSLASTLNEIARNQSDKELSILQNTQDKKTAALQKQLDQGTINQEEYNRRSLELQDAYDRKARAIKIRAAQQEKQLALFQAFIAQSLAVLSVLKDQTIPFTVKPVFVALAIGQALAQIAAIAAKPIPAFKKGTKSKTSDGPGLIGEAGPELFQVNGKWGYAAGPMILDMPKGSKVIPTLETDKIMQRYNMTMPPVRQDIAIKSTSAPIDYDKLARKFGIEMGKLPLHVSGFDKNGPYEYTTTVQARMNYLKGRYGSR